MPIQRITTPTQSSFPISNTVRAGTSIFTSQMPRDLTTGEILVETDMATQSRQVFSNLKTAMEAAGGGLADVAQLTVFMVDSEDFADMNRVYAEMFPAPFPNRATVVVKALLVPGMRIEIMAHAHLSE